MVAKPGGSKGWVYGGGGRLHRVPHLFAGQRDHAGQPAPAAGPGVLHPPMPSSATAEEQIRKQSNSVKNRSAPAQVSRLRGGTGSGEQGAGAGSGGGGRGVGAPALSGSRALWGEVCEGPSPEASERPGLEGRARQRGALGTQPRLLTPAGRAMGHAGVGVGIGIQKADHTGAGGVQAVQEGARRPGAGACWVSARAPQAALGGPPPRRVRHRVLVSQGPGSSLALEGPSSAVPPGAHRGGGRPQHSHLALGLRLRPSWFLEGRFFLRLPILFEACPRVLGRVPDPEESVTVSSEKDLSKDVSSAESGAVSSWSPSPSAATPGPVAGRSASCVPSTVLSASARRTPRGAVGSSASWPDPVAPGGLSPDSLRGFRACALPSTTGQAP